MSKNILRYVSYGLYIVSCDDGKSSNGFVSNSFFQLSSSPKTFCLSVSKNNHTDNMIKESKRFCVSILDKNVSTDIITLFGFSSGRDTNKFKDIRYGVTTNNQPYLIDNVVGYIELEVTDYKDLGSHSLYFATMSEHDVISDGEVLTYAYYHKELKLGISANSPIYISDSNIQAEPKYMCKICGYNFKGDLESVENYKCPICGAGKHFFIKR